jgi:hypothetical protein
MSKVYAITNLDGYSAEMRKAAADALCDNNTENLDDYISLYQMKGLVEEHCIGYDNQDHPLLNEETSEMIFEEATVWINNVGLAKLAGKDLIECSFDDEVNDFIFWSKKKETESNDQSNRHEDMGNQK